MGLPLGFPIGCCLQVVAETTAVRAAEAMSDVETRILAVWERKICSRIVSCLIPSGSKRSDSKLSLEGVYAFL